MQEFMFYDLNWMLLQWTTWISMQKYRKLKKNKYIVNQTNKVCQKVTHLLFKTTVPLSLAVLYTAICELQAR